MALNMGVDGSPNAMLTTASLRWQTPIAMTVVLARNSLHASLGQIVPIVA
jgi:hypothetical protein